MKETKTRIELLRKNIPELDIALSINKSNLEHIEFLENKVIQLEKNLFDEYKYINNLTKITGIECIEEYTTIMIKKLKPKELEGTCCGDEITQGVKETGRCPSCSENI